VIADECVLCIIESDWKEEFPIIRKTVLFLTEDKSQEIRI